jgi:GNAT superfamily N-acetyltransferase
MQAPFFCDRELARRIEHTRAVVDRATYAPGAEAAGFATPPATLEVAGGLAVYAGPGLLLNGAVGMGLDGPVSVDELRELDRFFDEHGMEAQLEVCPHADPSLVVGLLRLGYVPTGEYESVLVVSLARPPAGDGEPCAPYQRRVPPRPPDPRVTVRTVPAEERGVWARLVAEAFTAPEEPSEADLETARVIAAIPSGVVFVVAMVDGELAGTGSVAIGEGIGILNSAATLPRFRGLGVQGSLVGLRLDLAAAAGCDLALTETVPGSGSQRNMERNGFRVAYTRATWGRLRARIPRADLRS